jgi:hypothetical protein
VTQLFVFDCHVQVKRFGTYFFFLPTRALRRVHGKVRITRWPFVDEDALLHRHLHVSTSPYLGTPRHLSFGLELKMVEWRDMAAMPSAASGCCAQVNTERRYLCSEQAPRAIFAACTCKGDGPSWLVVDRHRERRRSWCRSPGQDSSRLQQTPAPVAHTSSDRSLGQRLVGAQAQALLSACLPLALALASRCLEHLKLFTPPPFVVPLSVYISSAGCGNVGKH